MDKNRKNFLLRFIISFGIVLFAVNSIFFYIESPSRDLFCIILASFIIQVILGFIIIYLSLKNSKKAYQFFIGLILSGWGIISGLITFILPYDDSFWWPLYLAAAGAFLALAGVVKYRKIKYGYIIPSVTLFLMGIWFALFSFKILKVSFKTVVVLLGPAFIVLIAISLILVFLIQQRHKKFIVKDDNSGDFDDEELSILKLD